MNPFNIPTIRKVTPSVIAHQLVSVQPMSFPISWKDVSNSWAFDVKIPKTKNGQPHWRTFRMLKDDNAHIQYWATIRKEMRDEGVYNGDSSIREWLVPQLDTDTRWVYDIQYRTTGVHFDTLEAKARFILRWS